MLSWPRETHTAAVWPALCVLGACFAWGLDNNLTRHVSMVDATWLASVKGLVAGSMNLELALLLGATWPAWPTMVGALLVGWLTYGVSLSLFVICLRQLGTGRVGQAHISRWHHSLERHWPYPFLVNALTRPCWWPAC